MKNTHFVHKDLLTPPAQRAAYSDRMAYVCAELARLAYFPFEGGARSSAILQLVKRVSNGNEDAQATVDRIRDLLGHDRFDEEASKEEFRKLLEVGEFELVDTFFEGDTQGFVCTRGEGSAFLVYRGTESIGDALDDADARLTAPFKDDLETKVHTGFHRQLISVDKQVKKLLKRVSDRQLFITGHSLGGALAVLATRVYSADANGACYTFGAPSVGNTKFQHPIKTPIYRVVNDLDPVARVPNVYLGFVTQFLLMPINYVLGRFGIQGSKEAAQFAYDLKQYRQNGYVGYLLPAGGSIVMRQGSSLTFLDRARRWVKQGRRIKGMLALGDFHRMDNYVDRLSQWANQRKSK